MGFVGVSGCAIALVVFQARRDAADPMRCAGLVPMGNRCCAPGQVLEAGRCLGRPVACPAPLALHEGGCQAPPLRITLHGGTIHAGAGDWEAEGRVPAGEREVATVAIDAFELSEGSYSACAAAGACVSLPLSGEPGRAVGGMTREEAAACCRFRGGRLPTSDEWTLAAAGTRSRRYPWGDTGAVCRRGAWGLSEGPCGFGFLAPEITGAHPDGATPDGIHDLAGNVSEWVVSGPGSEGGVGEVRGGSYVAELATDLRTWKTTRLSALTRSQEIGARCAYDVAAAEPHPAAPVVTSPIP